MRYNLAQLTRRANPGMRRKTVLLRKVAVPGTFASNLYAAAYGPVVALWQDAMDAIMAQYERSLAEITADSAETSAAAIGRVENDANAIMLAMRVRLTRWAQIVEAFHRGKWRGAVLTATGVDIGTMIGPSDARMTLGTAIERNVELVSSVSDQMRQRIADAVFRGFTKRRPAADVAKELADAVEMGRKRARNIAADQTVKLAAQLNRERRQEAGLDKWEWIHSGKLHYRPEHKARDGKRYSDADAPDDLPGELPYCGCTERAVLDLDGEF